MLCMGVLFCFVSGALCNHPLVSLGQDSCIHEANQLLNSVDKFVRAKISSQPCAVGKGGYFPPLSQQ